jgi:hypothetical protein
MKENRTAPFPPHKNGGCDGPRQGRGLKVFKELHKKYE